MTSSIDAAPIGEHHESIEAEGDAGAVRQPLLQRGEPLVRQR